MSPTLEGRFWSKVDMGPADTCWEWQASLRSDGYGRFAINSQPQLAHRVAYRLEYGEPSSDMVLHTCDNRKCVNPGHLYEGNQSDNMNDAYNRNRHPEVGEQHHTSKLTEDNVLEIRERVNNELNADLAEEFGVTPSQIYRIDKREVWKNV